MAAFVDLAENLIVDEKDLKLSFPSNIAIAGPTYCVRLCFCIKKFYLIITIFKGKTHLLLRMLLEQSHVFAQVPERIIYVYAHYQQKFQELKTKLNITFVQGFRSNLAEILELEKRRSNSPPWIVIFDDVIEQLTSGKKSGALTWLSVTTHHANLITIIVTQSLFLNPYLRLLLRQCQLLIYFENVRARQSLRQFSRQIFESDILSKVMEDISKNKRFGFLVLDLSPRKHEHLRIRDNLTFAGEQIFVYVSV